MRLSIQYGCLCALGLLLWSCGGGQGTSDMRGAWQVVSIGTAAKSVECPGVLRLGSATLDQCGSADTYRLNAGGALEYVERLSRYGCPLQRRGSWRQDGDTLTLTFNQQALDSNGDGVFSEAEAAPVDPPETSSFAITLTGGTATVCHHNGFLWREDSWRRVGR